MYIQTHGKLMWAKPMLEHVGTRQFRTHEKLMRACLRERQITLVFESLNVNRCVLSGCRILCAFVLNTLDIYKISSCIANLHVHDHYICIL